ncbi:RNase adapter RapZ [Defluviitalea phaphyphila]|uniref:RNase adapter RapZ n=1 Tax=Defluviitalea phaphyphila TaxID=1473580 RepID=UPI000731CB2C|nr:RNase adapter RapZ [Defluviitalea phaphyphila]
MRFVIVTGMSGAGKSTAIKMLEDIGFFCVDNLPPSLISKFAEICSMHGNEFDKVALGIDTRGGILFSELFEGLESLKNKGYKYEILFLDASDDILVKRFKETRRRHPLIKNERINVGIEKERKILKDVKEKADYIIDTSNILTRQLKEELFHIFIKGKKFESLIITVLSFGFKYGIPTDSDLVFDVRFIPNPYYIPEMRQKTGNDIEVQEYVMSWDESKEFLKKMVDLVEFLIPNYIKEGKNQLVISIGCTGGKHRSVTLANELHHILKNKGHRTVLDHRDIDKDNKLGK